MMANMLVNMMIMKNLRKSSTRNVISSNLITACCKRFTIRRDFSVDRTTRNDYHVYSGYRLYHCSMISLGPKNKKSSSTDSSGATLPDVKDIKSKMESCIDKFSKELSTLKIGVVTADIFNNINVGSYGTVTNLGQVTIKSATNINISVFDPSTTKLISDAIKDSGLGLSPTVDGSNISVFIPKPSKDSRELMKKSASKMAEKVNNISTIINIAAVNIIVVYISLS